MPAIYNIEIISQYVLKKSKLILKMFFNIENNFSNQSESPTLLPQNPQKNFNIVPCAVCISSNLSLKIHLFNCYLWSIYYILQRAKLYQWSHRWENKQFIPRVHLLHDWVAAWAPERNRRRTNSQSYTQTSGLTRNSGVCTSPTDR